MVSSEMNRYSFVAHFTLCFALFHLALQPLVGAESTTNTQLKAYLDSSPPHRIDRIQLTPTELSIFGTLTQTETKSDAQFHIAEILPHQSSANPTGWRNLGQIKADPKTGQFQFTAPFDSQNPFPRFAIVEASPSGLVARSHAVWPTDFQAIAKTNLPLPPAKSKKGLNGIHPDARLLPDLVELSVGHTALNFTLGSLLAAPDKGEEYDAGFARVRIDPKAVAGFDRVMDFCAKNGIEASAILLNPRKHSLTELAHPDATEGAFSAPNMKTAEGVKLYAAAVKYLAERYSAGGEHGRIARWIVGNEVDAAWEWTNAGEKTAHEFMDEYVRALRIVDAVTRRIDTQARTYISLTHHWNGKGGGKDNPRYYRGRELLEILSRNSRLEGDFPWGVAYHPYPEDLFNPKTWADRTATDSFDSPRITFKNIEVLDRFLRQKEFLYRGEKVRSIMLSEQGFNSGKNTPDELKNQAAALAYAWKKVKRLDSIEAFHYHRWIDHEHEGGLNLGLWTVKKGSITWPETKKPAYELFKKLDTADEDAACEFALPIVGLKNWNMEKSEK